MQREDRLRSLERERMYSIFAPLDPEERLPRELLIEQRRFRSVGRREAAGLLWLPELLAAITAVRWVGGGAPAAVGAAAAVLASLSLFARSDRPHRG